MTASETKVRIEKELAEIAATFKGIEHLVKYEVQVGENEIEGDVTDITYIFGSFSVGKPDASEEDRLYLSLDTDLDDEDNVDDAQFEENLAAFKENVTLLRDRLLSSENPEDEVDVIIKNFDKNLEEKYKEEIERLNRTTSRNLKIAAIATLIAGIAAIIILVFDKISA